MNFIKRAFLSEQAGKGKSLFLFAGFSSQNVAETASDLTRKKLGVDVLLGLNQDELPKYIEKQREENQMNQYVFNFNILHKGSSS